MFSNESRRQADSCRFCWMCRHICPVAGGSGNEGWTPRAKALMISMIERGQPFTPSIAELMYHCSMCEACSNDCATGFRPTDFIREARTLAVAEDIAPRAIMKEIDCLLQNGSIYEGDADTALMRRIRSLPVRADTLLYIGQTARMRNPATAVAVMDLLEKAGISYCALEKEPPSGAMLAELMGYAGDVQQLAKEAAEAIRNTGAKELVVLSPLDAEMMINTYAKWNLLTELRITTVSSYLASLLERGVLTCQKTSLRGCLQEPVKLTRGLDEIQPLLHIADHIGIELIPLFLNGKMSRCIGTPVLDGFDPDAVDKMLEVRYSDLRRLGGHLVFSASPDDAYLFKKYPADDIRHVELYALLNERC